MAEIYYGSDANTKLSCSHAKEKDQRLGRQTVIFNVRVHPPGLT
ncbi:MAG: hypothetical protein ACLUOD_18705 [[Clostridium] innocuum]